MVVHSRPRCPLLLVVEDCSYLVNGNCYHSCWDGGGCPAHKVTEPEFRFWQRFPASESARTDARTALT